MRLASVALSLLAFVCSTSRASLDGAGSIMIIPIVAQTVSYSSEVTVRNPYDEALPITVSYTGGIATTSAGLHACSPLSVPGRSSVQFNVASQCAIPATGQFGYLTLTETASAPSPFQAYSRSQTPGGNGFSVPAYPAGAIEPPLWGFYVLGLKRQAGAPTYQTNCYLASTGRAVNYTLSLEQNDQLLGSPLAGTLQPHQMVRYLDVFAAAGLATGDYSNVTADVESDGAGGELMAFCTVQESTFFGADFRMAQPVEVIERARLRMSFMSDGVYSPAYGSRHLIALRYPDRVRCYITSASASNLELRVVSPDGVSLIAGGNNLSDTGTFAIENRASYEESPSPFWHLDVSVREPYSGTFPIDYDVTCETGNGSNIDTASYEFVDDF